MVDDILLTPEEQDERARRWLKENGLSLAVGIGLGLAAIFGYQNWQAKQVSDAQAASSLYNQALSAIQDSELADFSSQLDSLKSDYSSSSYAIKASLLRARQLAVSDLDAAKAELNWALENADETGLQHTARIRLIKVLIASDELDKAKALATESQDAAVFSSNYNELLGDIAVKQNDDSAARDFYQRSLEDLAQQAGGYASILNLKLNRLPAEPEVAESAEASQVEVETAKAAVEQIVAEGNEAVVEAVTEAGEVIEAQVEQVQQQAADQLDSAAETVSEAEAEAEAAQE